MSWTNCCVFLIEPLRCKKVCLGFCLACAIRARGSTDKIGRFVGKSQHQLLECALVSLLSHLRRLTTCCSITSPKELYCSPTIAWHHKDAPGHVNQLLTFFEDVISTLDPPAWPTRVLVVIMLVNRVLNDFLHQAKACVVPSHAYMCAPGYMTARCHVRKVLTRHQRKCRTAVTGDELMPKRVHLGETWPALR